MILSDVQIRKLCEKTDKPLIYPFNEEHLQGASYDISMSNIIHAFDDAVKTVNIADAKILENLYKKIDIEGQTFVIKPGEYILVTLNEKVCVPTNMVAHIRPRTKFTRLGLIITDQHCNPGYEGVLQVGIRNVSPNSIVLTQDLQIGQFIFEELTEQSGKPYNLKDNSSYQGEEAFVGAKFEQHEFSQRAQEIYKKLLSGDFSDD